MKRLIYQLLLFSIPVFVFVLISCIYYVMKRSDVKSEMREISQYESLIMGDSQMQRIKPEHFSLNTLNFGSSAEHYYFTYEKIRDLISYDKSKLQQVILGLNLHSLAPVYSRRFDTDFPEGRTNLFRYLYFLDLRDQSYCSLQDIFSMNFMKGIYTEPDWGGISQFNSSNPDSAIIEIGYRDQFSIVGDENPYAYEQITWLSKIDSLCYANDVDLYLVTLPYHILYTSKIDDSYTVLLEQTIEGIKYATHLRFNDINIAPELLSDGTHLNTKGSDIFSKMIDEAIQNSQSLISEQLNLP